MTTMTTEPLATFSLSPRSADSPSRRQNLRRTVIRKQESKREQDEDEDEDDDEDDDDEEEETETESNYTRFAQSSLQHQKLRGTLIKKVEGKKVVEEEEEEEEIDEEIFPRYYMSPLQQKLHGSMINNVVRKNEGEEEVLPCYRSPLQQKLRRTLIQKVEAKSQEDEEENSSVRFHKSPLQQNPRQTRIMKMEEREKEQETEETRKPISDSRPKQQEHSSADSSSCSDGEYSRPRIREDLLPHDFLTWRTRSPSLSDIANKESSFLYSSSSSSLINRSSGQEQRQADSPLSSHSCRHHRYSRSPGSGRMSNLPRFTSSDLHLHQARRNLSDMKMDQHHSSSSSSHRPQNLSFHDRKENTAFSKKTDTKPVPKEFSKKPENLNESENEVYQNLVEMFPLIRSLMETSEDGSRGNFQHHAAMVYTRAPSRDEQSKKVANWMRNLKNSRRKHSIDDTMTCGAQKGAFIRKTTIEDLSSRRVPNDDNEMEIVKLRDQVEELERRLATREGMLEICYQHAKQNSDGNSEVIRLSSHIEELQRQLAEKDMQWASARELLQHKENEIESIQKRMYDAEETCAVMTRRNASNEQELNVLRCEVAALRWQLEIDAGKHGQSLQGIPNNSVSQIDVVGSTHTESQVSQVEAVRKVYFASIIVARIVPTEECLALVHELRIQLQYMLHKPAFGFELNKEVHETKC